MVRKHALTVRLNDRHYGWLEELTEILDQDKNDVMRQALREMAERRIPRVAKQVRALARELKGSDPQP